MDVKRIGRIPDSGGWRAHGRAMGSTADEEGDTCGQFLAHAAV